MYELTKDKPRDGEERKTVPRTVSRKADLKGCSFPSSDWVWYRAVVLAQGSVDVAPDSSHRLSQTSSSQPPSPSLHRPACLVFPVVPCHDLIGICMLSPSKHKLHESRGFISFNAVWNVPRSLVSRWRTVGPLKMQ